MQYSIDTSSLVDAYARYYAPDVFPRWWDLFEETARAGVVKISQAVVLDLERKDDQLHAWVKSRPHLVMPIDAAIQAEVSGILTQHERLVDTRKNRSASDPFVIALASLNNACVITGEHPSGNVAKPNIPDVCQAMGIPCGNLLRFMREMRWRIE